MFHRLARRPLYQNPKPCQAKNFPNFANPCKIETYERFGFAEPRFASGVLRGGGGFCEGGCEGGIRQFDPSVYQSHIHS